jgi:fibronectin-binding autotransporter adhesin
MGKQISNETQNVNKASPVCNMRQPKFAPALPGAQLDGLDGLVLLACLSRNAGEPLPTRTLTSPGGLASEMLQRDGQMTRNSRRLVPLRFHCGFAAIALLLANTTSWAQDCGRPAIFWISGSGSFDTASNFASAGGAVVGCAPLPTDNVVFGAYPGVFPTSGTVTFAGGETVNTLLVDSAGWTFALGGNINVTNGASLGPAATLTGGFNIVSSPSTGGLSATSLVIPDSSGFTGASVNIGSLTMSGAGASLSMQTNSYLTSVNISRGTINQAGGVLDIDTGAIAGSSISAAGATVLFNADAAGQAVGLNATSVVANQLYIGLGHGDTTTATASNINARTSTLYDTLLLQQGTIFSSGALTVGGGALNVQGDSVVQSTSALVSGNAATVTVNGPSSLWNVYGPLSISNGMVSVAGGARANINSGNSITVASTSSLGSGLTVQDFNSLLDVDSDVTLGTVESASGLAVLSALNEATVSIGGTLTVGSVESGLLTIQSGASVEASEVTLGDEAGSLGSMNISGGALNVENGLTVGDQGTGSVKQSGGSVSASSLDIGTSGSSDATVYQLSGGTLRVGSLDLGAGLIQSGGAIGVTGDFNDNGNFAIAGLGSALNVQGAMNVGGDGGPGNVSQSAESAVTVSGTLTIDDQGTYTLGANSDDTAALNALEITLNGTGTFSQVGGKVTVTSDVTTGGAYELSGGTLQAGSLSIQGGGAFDQTGGTSTILGDVDNGGALNISASSMQVEGRYTQEAGATLTLAGGTLDPIAVLIAGGTVKGTGTIVGPVTLSNAVLVEPGSGGAGALHVQGSYTQTGGTLLFGIGTQGSAFTASTLLFDPGKAISISNTNIVLDFLNGANAVAFFASTQDNLDTFLTESDLSRVPFSDIGSGDTFDYQIAGGALLSLDFNSGTGGLSVASSAPVPLPASLLLLLSGMGMLLAAAAPRRKFPFLR